MFTRSRRRSPGSCTSISKVVRLKQDNVDRVSVVDMSERPAVSVKVCRVQKETQSFLSFSYATRARIKESNETRICSVDGNLTPENGGSGCCFTKKELPSHLGYV